ncbi:MAG: hypothetical protein CMM39_12675 [Rhodospirillaceae bacterium]|nr:hypothetical protein [Rhodospirillaceae bacterium]
MVCSSKVTIKDLSLEADIGSCNSKDNMQLVHLLDLSLVIDPSLVLIKNDGMELVFDYDPLIAKILQLSGECHYDTQERLLTRIIHACAGHAEIQRVTVNLRKTPVVNDGFLGLEVTVDNKYLDELRLAS